MSDSKDDDLNFWMDSNSNVNESDVSSDSDIPLPKPPPSPSSIPQKSRQIRSKKSVSDEYSDDIIEIEKSAGFEQNGNRFLPPELTSEITYEDDDYKSSIKDPSLYAKKLDLEFQNLKNALNELKKEDNDDDDDDADIISTIQPKNEGDLTLFIIYDEDHFHTEVILRKGEPFNQLFDELPEKYRNFNVKINGLLYTNNDIDAIILDDYDRIELVKPENTNDLDGLKKLSFVLPNGDKKKLALDPNETFRQVLTKLNILSGKLLFDGDTLDLNQKIMDNDEIEDGDQIDIEFV